MTRSLILIIAAVATLAAGCKRFPSRVTLTDQGRLERESRGLEPTVVGVITRADATSVYVKTSAGETPVARSKIAKIDYPGGRERVYAILGVVAGLVVAGYGAYVMECQAGEASAECGLSAIGGVLIVVAGVGIVLTSASYGVQASVDGGRSRDLVEQGVGAPPPGPVTGAALSWRW
jgi:hypothetical protein